MLYIYVASFTLAMTGTVGKERAASYEGGATPELSKASFGDGCHGCEQEYVGGCVGAVAGSSG